MREFKDMQNLTNILGEKLPRGTVITPCGIHYVHVHLLSGTYRVTTDLNVEKVDGACLVTDSDARQLEKLLRGEQWDGTGLPPVGTECEVWFKNDDSPKWYNFRALFQTEQHVVAVVGGEEISYKTSEVNSNDVKFRPLRTERDKAIEQMLSTVTNYNNTSVIHAAGQIYDAIVAGKIDGLGKVG